MKQSEIKPGDCLFVWGESLIDEAIEFITHGPNHVAIFINQDEIAEFQGGRKSGISPLSDYLNADNHLEVWRDITLTDSEREKIVQYALNQSSQDYDYMGIFVELLRYETGILLDYNEGKKRICSTFVNDCFSKTIGKKLSNQKLPSPEDLIEGKVLTRIGKLK